MANSRKKISELPPLSVASLDTTFVLGISGSTTYKISINNLTSSLDGAFATDLVTNTLSTSLDSKLSTSSFQSFSSSVHSEILAATNEQDLTPYVTNLVYGVLSQSVDSRIDNLELNSGSYLTSLNGAITSSSQLTSSYDERYVLSGSITQTTWDNIANKPAGIVSQSTDLTSLNNFTASISTASLVTSISNLNTYTASQSTSSLVNRLNAIENVSGSWITESETGSFLTSLSGAISSSTQVVGILSSLNSVSASLISKTGSYATTGSNHFYGNQLFEGSSFTNLNIGDTFGGGTVFYVTPTLTLIAQTSDLGGAYGRGSARPTGSALGDGLSNTNQAINQYPAETSTAFYVASTNTSNGYTDWYLPSTLELITLIGQIGGLGGGWYITSTGDREVRGSDGLEVGNATNNGSVRLIRQIYTNEKPADNNNTNISITGSLSVSGSIIGSTNFNTIVNKPTLISGSSQLTSSYDTRYTLSGSVQPLPSNLVSSSAQITSLGFISSSTTINTGSFVTTSSFNTFTASAVTTGSNTFSGSQIISGALYVTSITSISSSFSLPSGSSLMILSGSNIYVDSSGSITGSLSGSIFGIGDVVVFSSSVNSRLNSASGVAGTISGSAQITAFGFVSGSYETTGRGIYSSSAQLPSGIISGSSQLTSSYDTRYTLSGSITAVPTGTISSSAQITAFGFVSSSASTPAGTISGSSQLTSSFDGRYLVTGSVTSSILQLNTFTSSLNVWSSSLATTGSNSFNGNQTITGSLNVSSLAVISSSFTTNSSSLTLNSGSNFYLQNNGIAQITGSLVVSGSTISLVTTTLQIGTGSGDEGGEILLAKSVINNSLTGSGITIDSYQNRLRIFEQGGDARGVYIDITKAPTGVAAELMWKASGMVNAGTFVTLDNIKATLTSSSNRGLSVATVSGTVTGYISGHYQGIAGASAGTSSTTSLSTTATSSMFGWNFTGQGDMSTYILRDDTNSRVYRIILIIGGSYLNNFISIERLY